MGDQMNGKCQPPSVEALAKAFGIDIVMPVRCRDCRNKVEDKIYGNVFCNRLMAAYRVRLDDFCSYGERKDDERE